MLVGYMRVSTPDQKFDLQKDALTRAGCEKLFHDVGSGAKAERKGLKEAIDFCRAGDTLVVWKLDRLGRSVSKFIPFIETLREKKIGFRSLSEGLDTTNDTPMGRALISLLMTFSEMEKDLVKERVNAGLAAARARGREGGRRPKLTPDQIRAARNLIAAGHTKADTARTLGVDRTTLYRALLAETDA